MKKIVKVSAVLMLAVMGATSVMAGVGIDDQKGPKGATNFNPQPDPPGKSARNSSFNPQPDPPGKSAKSNNFNPQPDPPGKSAKSNSFNPQPDPPGVAQ